MNEKNGELSTYEHALGYTSVLRQMIQHENHLVNQRLGWMFTLQGLLFAATGVQWEKSIYAIVLFSLIGTISCISIGYTLTRGVNAIKFLLAKDEDFEKTHIFVQALPPTIGSSHKAIDYLLPSKLLPWVFGFSWVAIIIIRFTTLP